MSFLLTSAPMPISISAMRLYPRMQAQARGVFPEESIEKTTNLFSMQYRQTLVSSPNLTASKISLPKRQGQLLNRFLLKMSSRVSFNALSLAMIYLMFLRNKQERWRNLRDLSTFEILFRSEISGRSLVCSSFLKRRGFSYCFLMLWNSSFLTFSRRSMFSGSVCRQKQRLLLQQVAQSFLILAHYCKTKGLMATSSYSISFSPYCSLLSLFSSLLLYFFCSSLKLKFIDPFIFYYNKKRITLPSRQTLFETEQHVSWYGLMRVLTEGWVLVIIAKMSRQLSSPLINFIMRVRDQLITVGKIHSSVQEMLAEARMIVAPTFPHRKTGSPQLEIHLPPTKLNQHLKEILRQPLDSYKKIERQKRHNSLSPENYEVKESKQQPGLRNSLPQQVVKVASRHELENIMVHVENELLGKRNKRLLFKKKTVDLLPELPEIPIKAHSREIYRKGHQQHNKRYQLASKSYFTIVQKDETCQHVQQSHDIKEFRTLPIDKTETKENAIILLKQRNKKVKSQLLRSIEEKPNRSLQLRKYKKEKQQAIEDPGEERYEPWQVQYKKDNQFFDFNN